jgi:hypothetical protein
MKFKTYRGSFLIVILTYLCNTSALYKNEANYENADAQTANLIQVDVRIPEPIRESVSYELRCPTCYKRFMSRSYITQCPCDCEVRYFHIDCLRKWLLQNLSCPMCRKPIDKTWGNAWLATFSNDRGPGPLEETEKATLEP